MAQVTRAVAQGILDGQGYTGNEVRQLAYHWLTSTGGHCANCAAALDPVTPEPPSTPWYPDDSGEWVEVPEDLMEMPEGVERKTLVEILMKRERDYFNWRSCPDTGGRWVWDAPPHACDRIVAYKVVKP